MTKIENIIYNMVDNCKFDCSHCGSKDICDCLSTTPKFINKQKNYIRETIEILNQED